MPKSVLCSMRNLLLVVLASLVLSSCAGDSTLPTNSDDVLTRADLEGVLKDVRMIGGDFIYLYWAPRPFVENWLKDQGGHPSAFAVLGWSAGLITLLVKIANLVSGDNPSEFARAAGSPTTPDANPTPSSPRDAVSVKRKSAHPEIIGIGWQLGFGVGVRSWGGNDLDEPQPTSFTMGSTVITISDVIPSKLQNMQILLFTLYGISLLLSIDPVARLLGATGRFGLAIKLSMMCLCATCILVVVIFFLVPCIVGRISPTKKLSGSNWGCLFLLAAFFAITRCYLEAFSQFYSLSYTRLAISIVGGNVLSPIICRLLFAPLLLWIVRLQKLWDLIF